MLPVGLLEPVLAAPSHITLDEVPASLAAGCLLLSIERPGAIAGWLAELTTELVVVFRVGEVVDGVQRISKLFDALPPTSKESCHVRKWWVGMNHPRTVRLMEDAEACLSRRHYISNRLPYQRPFLEQ